MKRVFCPKCDEMILLSDEKIREALLNADGRLDVICDTCGHQLRMRLNTRRRNTNGEDATGEPVAQLKVVENAFGFVQEFTLYEGTVGIGRRNRDSGVDLAIITSDPSMDRHHCLIKAERKKSGEVMLWLADDKSRVGTFLSGRLLADGEWALLQEGDVITLGATSLIITPAHK